EFLNESLHKPACYFWIGLSVPVAGTGWTWVNSSHLDQDQFPLDLKERPGACGAIRCSSIIPGHCDLELRWICQREATKL
ncbi:KLRB1 protein, partial [Dasyornis broadbenti]|nr:KLRB1 protein [Dasyornis broadbenti]